MSSSDVTRGRALDIFAALSDLDEDILSEACPAPAASPRLMRGESGFSRFLSSGLVAAVLSVLASISLITAIVLAGRLGDTPDLPPVGTTPPAAETLLEPPPETTPLDPSFDSETLPDGDFPPETLPPVPSEGLAYQPMGDTAVAVVGLGECRDRDVVIPETTPEGRRVIRIEDYAFRGCTSLTSVVIPAGVKTIGREAFSGCTGLVSVTLGEDVARVDARAFDECAPDRVMISDIGAWCRIRFADATANPLLFADELYLNGELVTELVLPDTLTSIGDSAFFNYSHFTSVRLPASLKSIGDNAFTDCKHLTNLTLPEGLESIGWFAFSGTGIASLRIPDSVTTMDEGAFQGCSDLTDLTLGASLTTLPSYAFYGCTSLANIEWSEGLTAIGNSAFFKCWALSGLTLPDGVTSIGNASFSDCRALTTVCIPASVRTVGQNAFAACGAIDTFTLEGTPESFKNNAFLDTAIRHLAITNLAGWCGIDFVAATSNPGSVAEEVSVDGEMLYDLVVPAGVREIASFAFSGWSMLWSVDTGETVESVGQSAFSNCSNIAEIELSPSVRTVHLGALGCHSQSIRVYIDDLAAFMNIHFYDVADNPLSNKGKLYLQGAEVRDLVVPAGVTRIGSNTFRGYAALESLTLPADLVEIGDYAFSGCLGLTDLSFGGDSAAWAAVKKGKDWDKDFPEPYLVRCTDGDIVVVDPAPV